ncbi:MAG: hypothetical protein M1302_00990 [Candidatus Thermoplasmatota archaeon]|nr:hypothetical protein [Candidatus Thermoplasmatota archaeon]
MSKSYEAKTHGNIMSGKCLDKLAAHGLEILLALNSPSCRLLDPAHPRRHGKVPATSTVENKSTVQAKKSGPRSKSHS